MPDLKDTININIVDGESFFAHELTVNFTPTQFTLDFKCITPRTDPRTKRPSFLLKHNVVMIDPWHAKMILSVLGNVVKRYEDEFGEIKKPKALEKVEKRQKASQQNAAPTKTDAPTYVG